LKEVYVCCETIYNAIYALPIGQLRKEISVLAKGKVPADNALAALIGAGRSLK
jgi:hypothetical protein